MKNASSRLVLGLNYSLCVMLKLLTEHHALKAYWGSWRYGSTHSLTLALDEGEWSVSRPGRFTRRERAPDTHWIGGWVGLRAGLNAVVRRKVPSPCRDLNPPSSSPYPSAILLRKMPIPKKNEGSKQFRMPYNEELCDLSRTNIGSAVGVNCLLCLVVRLYLRKYGPVSEVI
jgi:hypothetical protein